MILFVITKFFLSCFVICSFCSRFSVPFMASVLMEKIFIWIQSVWLCRGVPNNGACASNRYYLLYIQGNWCWINPHEIPHGFLSGLHNNGCCISPFTPLTLDNIAIWNEGKICIQVEYIKLISLVRNEGEATILASQVKSGCASGVSADYRNALLLFKDLLKHSAHLLFSSC